SGASGSTIVAAPAPLILSPSLPGGIVTFSLKVPGATSTESPAAAASTPDWIVGWQVASAGLTQMVAAPTREGAGATTASDRTARRVRRLIVIPRRSRRRR